jgi:hypothetical protein
VRANGNLVRVMRRGRVPDASRFVSIQLAAWMELAESSLGESELLI